MAVTFTYHYWFSLHQDEYILIFENLTPLISVVWHDVKLSSTLVSGESPSRGSLVAYFLVRCFHLQQILLWLNPPWLVDSTLFGNLLRCICCPLPCQTIQQFGQSCVQSIWLSLRSPLFAIWIGSHSLVFCYHNRTPISALFCETYIGFTSQYDKSFCFA